MNLSEKYMIKADRKKYGFKIGLSMESKYKDTYTIIQESNERKYYWNDNIIANNLGLLYLDYEDVITQGLVEKIDFFRVFDRFNNTCIYFKEKSVCINSMDNLCRFLRRR